MPCCSDCERRAAVARADGKPYPWDECIADALKEYGDQATAEKVCGSIKAKYGDANTVIRFDRGRLGAVKALPAGGIRVDANISRTGIQEYVRNDGTIRREYRPPEEVFSEDSLASLGAAPVTRGHPGAVDPKNWKTHAVGTVSDSAPRREKIAADEFVVSALNVQDAGAIGAIESGALAEISAGYSTILNETPGVVNGERYDAIQMAIRYNHVALLPVGQARAGRSARLRLDGNQDTLSEEAKTMPEPVIVKVRLDGIEYVEGSREHVAALDAKIKAGDAKIAELTGKLDAAGVELTKARADSATARTDAAVEELLAFRERVRPVLPKGYDFKGKPRATVVADALKNLKGVTLKADASTAEQETYLSARIDAIGGHDYNDGRREDGGEQPRTSVTREDEFHAHLDAAFTTGINGGAGVTDRGATEGATNKGAK